MTNVSRAAAVPPFCFSGCYIFASTCGAQDKPPIARRLFPKAYGLDWFLARSNKCTTPFHIELPGFKTTRGSPWEPPTSRVFYDRPDTSSEAGELLPTCALS